MTSSASIPGNERLAAAAQWHARLSEDRDETEWQAFAAWLEADPGNREAFDAVDLVAQDVADHADALADRIDLSTMPARRSWRSVTRRVWMPAALTAAALLAVFLKPVRMDAPVVQAFATGVGERKDVNLSDGSTVHLNTDTVVSFSMTEKGRNARLDKGEALFEVAADAGRPFDVAVGDRNVRVVGTAFDIRRLGTEVTVTVKHGIVQIRAISDANSATALKLRAGDQYSGREGSAEYVVSAVDPAAVAGWQQGRLLFNDAPLSQVAADLSRYFTRPVMVEDESVGNLRFSGILKIDDELAMVRRLAAFVPISVQESEDKVVLKRKTSK